MHPSTVGNLGCVQIVAIVNNAAVNTGVHIFFCSSVLVSLDIFPEVELLGHKAVIF